MQLNTGAIFNTRTKIQTLFSYSLIISNLYVHRRRHAIRNYFFHKFIVLTVDLVQLRVSSQVSVCNRVDLIGFEESIHLIH